MLESKGVQKISWKATNCNLNPTFPSLGHKDTNNGGFFFLS